MQRATGIGGYFLRAKDPSALARWYREALGVDTYSDDAPGIWRQEAGPTVVTPFPADTDYFGRAEQTHMLNLRVPDLDAMLEQLRGMGATLIDDVQVMEGIGRFSWVEDPEGNRIELWEPTPEAQAEPSAS
jgi:predicted enzyme related to lactoylglutathione lyase